MATNMARPGSSLMTNSRASAFRACPFKEFLRYEAGISGRYDAPPLRFGGLWHDCMEAVYRIHASMDEENFCSMELESSEVLDCVLDDTGSLNYDFIPRGGVIKAWAQQQKSYVTQRWNDYTGSYTKEQMYADEEIDGMAELAEDMLRRYLETWWALDRKRWIVLHVELEIRVPLLTSTGHKSTKWDFAGKLDLVVMERHGRGRIFVVDHKSSAKTPEACLEDFRVDPQAIGYAWLAEQSGICEGHELGGVIYRVSRKKIPAVPKRNLCTGKKSDGVVMVDGKKDHSSCTMCLGTGEGPVSKSACDTTENIYRTALAEAAASGFAPLPKHFEVLSEIQDRGYRVWFDEHEFDVTEDILFRWQQEMYSTTLAKNAAQALGEAGHWRVGSKLICRSYSRSCGMMDLCELYAEDTSQELRASEFLGDKYEFAAAHAELTEVDSKS